jgi:hypothetical protein
MTLGLGPCHVLRMAGWSDPEHRALGQGSWGKFKQGVTAWPVSVKCRSSASSAEYGKNQFCQAASRVSSLFQMLEEAMEISYIAVLIVPPRSKQKVESPALTPG